MSLITKRMARELNEKEMRDAYLGAQTRTHLAYQIRAIRTDRGWSQGELGQILHKPQSAVSRMEDREYGKFSLQTLFELASAFDCGLVVQFVPYAQFIQQTSDLSPANLSVPAFTPQSLTPLYEDAGMTVNTATGGEGWINYMRTGNALFGLSQFNINTVSRHYVGLTTGLPQSTTITATTTGGSFEYGTGVAPERVAVVGRALIPHGYETPSAAVGE